MVDRVRSRKESFVIVKLGVPHALLVPAWATGCNTHELAEDLAKAGLAMEDRRALAAAVRKGRNVLKSLMNPWG